MGWRSYQSAQRFQRILLISQEERPWPSMLGSGFLLVQGLQQVRDGKKWLYRNVENAEHPTGYRITKLY
jgi:hypothetical protein